MLSAEVEVHITCGKDKAKVKYSELGDLYLKWLTEMHNKYDEEFVKADDDEETYIFRNYGNCFKDLGVGDSQCERYIFETFHCDEYASITLEILDIFFSLVHFS